MAFDDLWASFWLNLTLYFFKFFLISLICSLDSSVGGLEEIMVYSKFKRNQSEENQALNVTLSSYLGLQTSWQNFSTELLFKILPWKFQSQ